MLDMVLMLRQFNARAWNVCRSSLITGNCIIVKPSPFTPYAVLKWVELARGILPPGVFELDFVFEGGFCWEVG